MTFCQKFIQIWSELVKINFMRMKFYENENPISPCQIGLKKTSKIYVRYVN